MTHKYKGSRHLLKVFKLISQIYPMQAWKEANLHNLVKGVQLSPELLDRIQGCNARLNRMRVDLYVPGQVAIEVHGEQHDRPVRFSNEIVDPDEELLRRRDFDEIKARALQEAGVPFVTLWYHELDTLTAEDLELRIANAQIASRKIPAYKIRNVKTPKHRTKGESFDDRKERLDKARQIRKDNYRIAKARLKEIPQ